MIKKIFGVFFLLIAIILGLAFLGTLPKTLTTIFSNFSAYSFGYAIGNLFFLALSIFLFKLGIKWLKNKSKTVDTINEIGKN